MALMKGEVDDWYTSAEGEGTPYQNKEQAQPGATVTQGSGYRHYGESFTPPPSGGLGGGSQQHMAGGPGVGCVAYDPSGEDYSMEPPLLEELGINFEHIWAKTYAVMVPNRAIDITYLDETDLAGPLVFALIFGFCLLFTGKVHFGYIYGFGGFGCVSITLLLNLLGESKSMDVWKTVSVLGYCLLPVVVLSALDIVLNLKGTLGLLLAVVAMCWCTVTATKLLESYLSMRAQRYLIAYPIGLFYSCFLLITIF